MRAITTTTSPLPLHRGDGSPCPEQPIVGKTLGEIIDVILAAVLDWSEDQLADAKIVIEDDGGRRVGHVEFGIRPPTMQLYMSDID